MTAPKNIYQRLSQVMAEVESVQRESKKVNNQYTFVSHDGVSKALHMPMVRAGIVMVPTIADLVQDGNRTVAKMDIAFINIDQPEDRVVVNYVGYGIDQQDKGIGKAISYAVKYALLKVFCLETGDDVEKDNINHVPDPVAEVIQPVQTLSDDQVDEILGILNGDKAHERRLCEFFNVLILNDIPAHNFKNIVTGLAAKKTNKVAPIKERSA